MHSWQYLSQEGTGTQDDEMNISECTSYLRATKRLSPHNVVLAIESFYLCISHPLLSRVCYGELLSKKPSLIILR